MQLDSDYAAGSGSVVPATPEKSFEEHDIWNLDTYDIVVLLRHRVSRYRVFAYVVGPCLRPRRSLLRQLSSRCRSNYDVVGKNYDVNSAHRVCYDIVVQNYDVVGRIL